MKRISCVYLILLIGITASSQQGKLQKEINEQVWKPLITAFNNKDDGAFTAVHSKKVIRVSQDENQVLAYDEYFKKIAETEKAKWRDTAGSPRKNGHIGGCSLLLKPGLPNNDLQLVL